MSVKYEAGSITTIASTELNSLANGSAALGAEYDNATNLYMWATFELNVTHASNPTADAPYDLYLIPAPDGTNYDDNTTGASYLVPVDCYVGSFTARATTSAQKRPLGIGRQIAIPPLKFKPFLVNRSGQAFPASGSTLKMVPYRLQ